MTCPYNREPTNGSIIPCVKANITNALKERDPVRAVMQQLEKIITDDFRWVMNGSDNDLLLAHLKRKYSGEISREVVT